MKYYVISADADGVSALSRTVSVSMTTAISIARHMLRQGYVVTLVPLKERESDEAGIDGRGPIVE